jgi:hypothetical protein
VEVGIKKQVRVEKKSSCRIRVAPRLGLTLEKLNVILETAVCVNELLCCYYEKIHKEVA